MNEKTKLITTHEKAILAISIGLIISTFLPWASAFAGFVTVDLTGMDFGLVWLFPIIGGVLCAIVFFSDSHTLKKRGSLVVGIISVFIIIGAYIGITRLINEYAINEQIQVTYGIGLYLAFLLSVGLLVLGVVRDKEALPKDITQQPVLIQPQMPAIPQFCTVCGTSIVGVKFCTVCGTEVAKYLPDSNQN